MFKKLRMYLSHLIYKPKRLTAHEIFSVELLASGKRDLIGDDTIIAFVRQLEEQYGLGR